MRTKWIRLTVCAVAAILSHCLVGIPLVAGEAQVTQPNGRGAEFDNDTIDQHLLINARGPRTDNCLPCPAPPQCPTPSPSGVYLPPGQTPEFTPPIMSPGAAPSLLASAAEGGGVGGPTFNNVPTMIGDIFSGVPIQPQSTGGDSGTLNNVTFPSSPSAGILKLADGTSPIPRDRLIFNYSFFQNVPLTADGLNVNRFVAGFEKTLFSDWFSVELTVPFATTLNQNVSLDASSAIVNQNAVELGDVTVWSKALLARRETWALSAGLGVMVPTASDLSVSVLGTVPPPPFATPDLYVIRNQTTYLLPFIGSVWTPTDRFFVQQFLQFDVATTGNSVYQNFNGTSSSTVTPNPSVFTGKLRDPTLMFYDISAGYWLFHDDAGSTRQLTGLAGIFEVHYNHSLSSYDSVPLSANTGFGSRAVIGGGGVFTSVNLTAGFVAEIRQNALLYVGATVPTVSGTGHEFDWQLLVNFNYLFGRSSKAVRSQAAGVPSTQ